MGKILYFACARQQKKVDQNEVYSGSAEPPIAVVEICPGKEIAVLKLSRNIEVDGTKRSKKSPRFEQQMWLLGTGSARLGESLRDSYTDFDPNFNSDSDIKDGQPAAQRVSPVKRAVCNTKQLGFCYRANKYEFSGSGCSGDDGGPIVGYDESDRMVLLGIRSEDQSPTSCTPR